MFSWQPDFDSHLFRNLVYSPFNENDYICRGNFYNSTPRDVTSSNRKGNSLQSGEGCIEAQELLKSPGLRENHNYKAIQNRLKEWSVEF